MRIFTPSREDGRNLWGVLRDNREAVRVDRYPCAACPAAG